MLICVLGCVLGTWSFPHGKHGLSVGWLPPPPPLSLSLFPTLCKCVLGPRGPARSLGLYVVYWDPVACQGGWLRPPPPPFPPPLSLSLYLSLCLSLSHFISTMAVIHPHPSFSLSLTLWDCKYQGFFRWNNNIPAWFLLLHIKEYIVLPSTLCYWSNWRLYQGGLQDIILRNILLFAGYPLLWIHGGALTRPSAH